MRKLEIVFNSMTNDQTKYPYSKTPGIPWWSSGLLGLHALTAEVRKTKIPQATWCGYNKKKERKRMKSQPKLLDTKAWSDFPCLATLCIITHMLDAC